MPRARRAGRQAGLTIPGRQAGLTIMEMLIVVMIVSLIAGLTFPSVSSGLESLRMRSAGDSVAGFLTQAMARVERSQQPVEITLRKPGHLEMRTPDPKFANSLDLPDGVTIHQILPRIPVENETARSIIFAPGGLFPRIGIELLNRRGDRRLIRIDPMASVAVVEIPAESVSTEER
ncbi:MAG: prepilin-type N-terminal cleavage/methylation domain-containing protein [Acidobacteria bacterium]|nr:prepilin-type N-terminal cleavage/methylation domain-containing protein [Acidobacteriota bacterium]